MSAAKSFADDLYVLRWLTSAQLARGVELWHLSRTALALDPERRSCRASRLSWAAEQLAKENPELKPIAAYKDLEAAGVGRLFHPTLAPRRKKV